MSPQKQAAYTPVLLLALFPCFFNMVRPHLYDAMFHPTIVNRRIIAGTRSRHHKQSISVPFGH